MLDLRAVAVLKRTLIPLAAAIVVALAAMGGLETMQNAPAPPVAELSWNAFAEGVDLKFHDAGGAVAYALQAANQTRFNDDSVEWSRPTLQLYASERHENGGADWHVGAEQGFIAPGADKLQLSGNVVLSRQGGEGDALTLTTTLLDIDLEGEILSTDEPVQMVAGGLRQDAAGLLLDLPEDSLLLLGRVRGSHVQP